MENSSGKNGALNGLKVVDLSRVLAGPYCTQLLADHGAQVTKIEPPAGDDTRHWGPPFVKDDMSAYYHGLNRNKKHVCIDLSSPFGQEILAGMLKDADVIVENFKAGTLAKWGLDDSTIKRLYPRLIHCRITGFGIDGPLGGAPGYDANLQAFSGLMSVNGEESGEPIRVGVPVVDMVTGIHAFSGVLLALNERERSGLGQQVECTLLDSAIGLLHPHSANWLADGREPVRSGSAHPSIAPYDVFTTADGDMFITVGNDRQFLDFARAIEAPWLLENNTFSNNAARVNNRKVLKSAILKATLELTNEELGKRLAAVGVPATPVNGIGDALSHPQTKHRQMVLEAEDYLGIGFPVSLSRTPASLRELPGGLGRDTRKTLEQYGYEIAKIDEFYHGGIVR